MYTKKLLVVESSNRFADPATSSQVFHVKPSWQAETCFFPHPTLLDSSEPRRRRKNGGLAGIPVLRCCISMASDKASRWRKLLQLLTRKAGSARPRQRSIYLQRSPSSIAVSW